MIHSDDTNSTVFWSPYTHIVNQMCFTKAQVENGWFPIQHL